MRADALPRIPPNETTASISGMEREESPVCLQRRGGICPSGPADVPETRRRTLIKATVPTPLYSIQSSFRCSESF